MATGFEASCEGKLVSLAGINGRPKLGLRVDRPDASINVGTGMEVLHANPARAWAMIQNTGAEVVYFSFDANTGIAAAYRLQVGETLQIDKNIPWTGSVYVASAAAGQVEYIEASVQP